MKNNNFTSGWVRPMEKKMKRGGGTSLFRGFLPTHIRLFLGSILRGWSVILGWCLDGNSWMVVDGAWMENFNGQGWAIIILIHPTSKVLFLRLLTLGLYIWHNALTGIIQHLL